MTYIIPKTLCHEIDLWVAKYPPDRQRSAIIPALLLVQDAHDGWLPEAAIEAVADYLSMPHIEAYEVATFYSMYELKPVGKHKICVCTNISCMLSGSEKIVDHLKNKLNINFGETTPDGKFTLKEVECLAACANAPMFQIGRDYYENLTPEKIDQILAELK
ncbi:MAG: NADH-quinone oxidoreductase subunit NuoE [Gammaproteobacteria bacterium]